jgi:hypothetical protein
LNRTKHSFNKNTNISLGKILYKKKIGRNKLTNSTTVTFIEIFQKVGKLNKGAPKHIKYHIKMSTISSFIHSWKHALAQTERG